MIVMGVFGVLYIVFAFVRPPEAVAHIFRVPSLFVFLPEAWIVPVGRFFVGVLILGGGFALWLKTH